MYEYCTVSEILSLSLINCMTSSDPRGYFGCWKSVLDMTPRGRYGVSDSVLLCRRVVGFELLLEYDRGMKTTFSATCRKSRCHDQKNLTSLVSSRVVRSEISRNFSRNISGHFPLRLHRHCRSHRQDFDWERVARSVCGSRAHCTSTCGGNWMQTMVRKLPADTHCVSIAVIGTMCLGRLRLFVSNGLAICQPESLWKRPRFHDFPTRP